MNSLREKFLLFRVLRFRDKQAYGELYTEYAPRLRRYLTFKLPTPQDADDVLAEVFMKVWDYITSTPVESLSGLLFAVARNRVADFYRSAGRRDEVAVNEAQERIIFTDEGVLASTMIDNADLQLLKEVVKELPHEQQAVVLLRYFDGLGVRQVAEHLGKTENNVRVMSHRALKTLKEMMDKKNHEKPRD